MERGTDDRRRRAEHGERDRGKERRTIWREGQKTGEKKNIERNRGQLKGRRTLREGQRKGVVDEENMGRGTGGRRGGKEHGERDRGQERRKRT